MALQFKSATGFDYVSAANPLPVTVVGGTNGAVINGTNPGAVTITTGPTNQNITLTPSGTGNVLVGSALTLRATSPGGLLVNGMNGAFGTSSSNLVDFIVNNAAVGRLTTGGNWLLGTTTDSSNGRLQVAGGQIACAASTTTYASILLPHGTAPSSPVDGQMWTTTAGLFVRINGATVGPLS